MSDRNACLLGWGRVLMCLLFFVLFIAGIVWVCWQYRLCMATIGDFWYCIQHAM